MWVHCPSCVLPCPAQPSPAQNSPALSCPFLSCPVLSCPACQLVFPLRGCFCLFCFIINKRQFFLQQLSPRSHPLPDPDRNGLKTCSKVCNKEARISNEVGLLQNNGWIRNVAMKQFHNQLQRKTSKTLFFFFTCRIFKKLIQIWIIFIQPVIA